MILIFFPKEKKIVKNAYIISLIAVTSDIVWMLTAWKMPWETSLGMGVI